MAKQQSLIRFTGKLGNLIGYERNGRQFLRRMPEKVRQTPATRLAAQRFGIASRRGALIRKAITGELDLRGDSTYINRLTRSLISSGGHALKTLEGFRFHQQGSISRFFHLVPKLTADGILDIPAQAMPVCSGIDAIEVKVVAAKISFSSGEIIGTTTQVIVLNTAKRFDGAMLPLHVPGRGTLVVTMQVRGMRQGLIIGNARYLAADIVGVILPTVRRERLGICHQTMLPDAMRLPLTIVRTPWRGVYSHALLE
ncbi:hypothetical protein [Chitinophaga rhizophila]|uniref:Uncharacterized protein n=1 Tax=Chitinophaga rhizophila TaxID=2866212 RepID=A0ABS7GLR1_9BACT|nr:hypothetical protein [Chitinophaga rhizophila]MBW8688321.1 hypothetical protein [Chitinophaga rhizophila]